MSSNSEIIIFNQLKEASEIEDPISILASDRNRRQRKSAGNQLAATGE